MKVKYRRVSLKRINPSPRLNRSKVEKINLTKYTELDLLPYLDFN